MTIRPSLEIALSSQSIPPVAHVANPSLNRWPDILGDLRSAGLEFEPVEASQWVEAMAKSEGDEVTNPSKKMLAMWRSAVRTSLRVLLSTPAHIPFASSHSTQAKMITNLLPSYPQRKRQDCPKAWQSVDRYRRISSQKCWLDGGNQGSCPSNLNR